MARIEGKVKLLKDDAGELYLSYRGTVLQVNAGSIAIHSLAQDARAFVKYGCIGDYKKVAEADLPTTVEVASASFDTKGGHEVTYKSSLPYGLKVYVTGN